MTNYELPAGQIVTGYLETFAHNKSKHFDVIL